MDAAKARGQAGASRIFRFPPGVRVSRARAAQCASGSRSREEFNIALMEISPESATEFVLLFCDRVFVIAAPGVTAVFVDAVALRGASPLWIRLDELLIFLR